MKKRQVAVSIPVAGNKRALWVAIESGNGFTVRYWDGNGTLKHRAKISLEELDGAISAARRHGYPFTDLMI